MNNHLELSTLTTKQLSKLLWKTKGTPQAQPIYAELSRRPHKFSLKLDDPDWDRKMAEYLQSKISAQPPN
jgi:hypothetical protein